MFHALIFLLSSCFTYGDKKSLTGIASNQTLHYGTNLRFLM